MVFKTAFRFRKGTVELPTKKQQIRKNSIIKMLKHGWYEWVFVKKSATGKTECGKD